MASIDVGNWIPEDWDSSPLVALFVNNSAALQIANSPNGRVETMTTRLKHVPKEAGADVQFTAKGATSVLDAQTAAQVLLHAKKSTYLGQFDDEDIQDASQFVAVLAA